MNAPIEKIQMISPVEAALLGARSGPFYSQYFFPKVVRQHVPEFHKTIWTELEDPDQRYVAVKVFRDGAKTTLLRLFASKRIAYGISHNILYTSNSERHAARSVSWIARQVEFNTLWAQTFNLRKGGKWSESEIEIIHGVEEFPIYVIAVGITGQVRGINLDSYRPDLQVCDDVDNEETTGTKEQREKARGLFFGALVQGLASPTDSPLAKVVLLATPMVDEDIVDTCSNDPSWKTLEYGCFDHEGRSVWEAKFPTEFLLKEKQAFMARNQLALWMREKECKIVSSELAAFRLEWLEYYEIMPSDMWFVIAIDPARSDDKEASKLAMVVLGFRAGHVYLVEEFARRGVDPDQVLAQVFVWIDRYHPRSLVVETIAYQKILKWYLDKEMLKQRKWIPTKEFQDRRSKDDRILQAFLHVAPHKKLHVKKSHTEFLSTFGTWFPGSKMKVDLLDAFAMGLSEYNSASDADLDAEYRVIQDEESAIPDLEFRSCP